MAPVGEGYNARRLKSITVAPKGSTASSITLSASPLPLSADRRTLQIRLLGGEEMEMKEGVGVCDSL
jgi:hypothetical protein